MLSLLLVACKRVVISVYYYGCNATTVYMDEIRRVNIKALNVDVLKNKKESSMTNQFVKIMLILTVAGVMTGCVMERPAYSSEDIPVTDQE